MSFPNAFKEKKIICNVFFDVDFQVCGTHLMCCSTRRELLQELIFLARCRNRNRNGTTNQKIKFEKTKNFGITTIVYYGKLQKNQKDKTEYAKNQILGPRVGHNARPKTIPLIKREQMMWFSKYLIFPKNNNK